jgi:hypothetical protein
MAVGMFFLKKTSAMLTHIALKPMWQSGKLFSERNFGDKKNIFLLIH